MSSIDRSRTPEPQPIRHFNLVSPSLVILDNGIPLHIVGNPNLDLIYLIIKIDVGILHEHQKHIAQFTYSLLKQSSRTHTSTEIADLLHFYGVQYATSESLDYTQIKISVPRKNLSLILPVVCDFLISPLFQEANLSIYRNLKIQNWECDLKRTDIRNARLMLHTFFGDKFTAGQFPSRAHFMAVDIPAMEKFHKDTFCAENLHLYVAGNLGEAEVDCISRLFSQVPHGKRALAIKEISMPADLRPVVYEEMQNSVQSSISIVRPLFGYDNVDQQDFSILSTITGGYFGSRLMQRLREKEGYTYGISCGRVYFGPQSLFVINSDVNIDDTKASIDACFEEIERIQTEPVGIEELGVVKNYLNGDMLRDVENSISYLHKFVIWDHLGVDESAFNLRMAHIRDITPERIQSLARKYFSYNNFTQIIVGKL